MDVISIDSWTEQQVTILFKVDVCVHAQHCVWETDVYISNEENIEALKKKIMFFRGPVGPEIEHRSKHLNFFPFSFF